MLHLCCRSKTERRPSPYPLPEYRGRGRGETGEPGAGDGVPTGVPAAFASTIPTRRARDEENRPAGSRRWVDLAEAVQVGVHRPEVLGRQGRRPWPDRPARRCPAPAVQVADGADQAVAGVGQVQRQGVAGGEKGAGRGRPRPSIEDREERAPPGATSVPAVRVIPPRPPPGEDRRVLHEPALAVDRFQWRTGPAGRRTSRSRGPGGRRRGGRRTGRRTLHARAAQRERREVERDVALALRLDPQRAAGRLGAGRRGAGRRPARRRPASAPSGPGLAGGEAVDPGDGVAVAVVGGREQFDRLRRGRRPCGSRPPGRRTRRDQLDPAR